MSEEDIYKVGQIFMDMQLLRGGLLASGTARGTVEQEDVMLVQLLETGKMR